MCHEKQFVTVLLTSVRVYCVKLISLLINRKRNTKGKKKETILRLTIFFTDLYKCSNVGGFSCISSSSCRKNKRREEKGKDKEKRKL